MPPFQFRETLPDRAAAEQVVVRRDWKDALQLPLASAGCAFSGLCSFRRRLLEHAQERLLFEQILGKIPALGCVTQRGKQRPDALAVRGAVRPLSARELVTATRRRALRALVDADAAWVERALPAGCVAADAARRSGSRLSAAERQAALHKAARHTGGREGVWLWARLDATAPAAVRDLEARHVRRTVWDQRSAPGAGRPRVRVRAQTGACTALRVTPHDPGVRAGEQRGQNWRGDNVHVPATAEPDAPRFIPEVTTAPAPRSAVLRTHGLRRQRDRGAATRPCANRRTGAAGTRKRLVRALGARGRGERDAAARALPVGGSA